MRFNVSSMWRFERRTRLCQFTFAFASSFAAVRSLFRVGRFRSAKRDAGDLKRLFPSIFPASGQLLSSGVVLHGGALPQRMDGAGEGYGEWNSDNQLSLEEFTCAGYRLFKRNDAFR